jgi:predicted nucleic acid-binding protein
MYLWDSNIIRAFGDGHPTLRLHLERVSWTDIAVLSVVVAEVLRGRSEFALKATPSQLPQAHALLEKTRQMLRGFQVLVFDLASANHLQSLLTQHASHKRYADCMIAALALAGQHVVVTRNRKHFSALLPPMQLANWIDELPA